MLWDDAFLFTKQVYILYSECLKCLYSFFEYTHMQKHHMSFRWLYISVKGFSLLRWLRSHRLHLQLFGVRHLRIDNDLFRGFDRSTEKIWLSESCAPVYINYEWYKQVLIKIWWNWNEVSQDAISYNIASLVCDMTWFASGFCYDAWFALFKNIWYAPTGQYILNWLRML